MTKTEQHVIKGNKPFPFSLPHPLLSALSESTMADLLKSLTWSAHEKGKIIFLAGDAAQFFFVIKSGWVKLFRETMDGDQSVVDVLSAGQIFGKAALFEGNTYSYSAEVVEDAEIGAMPLSLLKREIEVNNAFAQAMIKYMADIRRQQEQEIEHRSLQNAPQRIGCFLLRLTTQGSEGPATMDLPYDKTLLAARLGMQPETFSRALSRLREDTGIRIKGSRIEVDNLNTLSQYSCSACSSNFPCKDLKDRT
ncbi:MAG: Crp/Fnr family transcriptional regulator [Alphaproteobacteria bacterium]|nr:Crp/Fnr family transcriptional regulator [Alphaproteobacteria bacterium]